MKFTQSVVALVAAAGLTTASPVKRQAQTLTDADILNYALTLEHLENRFYLDGLANYTQEQFAAAGFDETFYNNLKTVSFDESVHVKFLTDALTEAGASPVAECTYNFGVSDPKSFVMLSSILEGVGVSAYLGAAADIMSKEYLTAAGAILTVEARHTAYVRAALEESPFPSPFDTPLGLNEVFTLAAQFIVSCPSTNVALPVKAFPVLTLGTKGPIKSGDTITLNTPNYIIRPVDAGTQVYGAFITLTGPIFVEATEITGGFTVQVPEGVNGQTYVVLTGCKDAVNDATVAAGPAIVEVTNPTF